jgi:hypothetical protein
MPRKGPRPAKAHSNRRRGHAFDSAGLLDKVEWSAVKTSFDPALKLSPDEIAERRKRSPRT